MRHRRKVALGKEERSNLAFVTGDNDDAGDDDQT